jgi:RNA polymerase sigma-70 factor (ECF subfamily)
MAGSGSFLNTFNRTFRGCAALDQPVAEGGSNEVELQPSSIERQDENLLADLEFESLEKKYYARIYGYAGKFTANSNERHEIAIIALGKAFTKPYRKGGNFAAWLFRIVHNEGISLLRRKKRELSIDRTTDDVGGSILPPVRPSQEQDVLLREVRDALHLLRVDEQELISLRHQEGFTAEETAQILDKTIDQVNHQLCDAMKHLRALLGVHPNGRNGSGRKRA